MNLEEEEEKVAEMFMKEMKQRAAYEACQASDQSQRDWERERPTVYNSGFSQLDFLK